MSRPRETGTYLDRILAKTIEDVAERKRVAPEAELAKRITEMTDTVAFADALSGEGVALIAEFKRASPSKGKIVEDADIEQIATAYIEGGASALSVLTDRAFFDGSLDDLNRAANVAHNAAPPVPVLRKDFIVDTYQVYEARHAGADAILLIVAALEDDQLRELHELAKSLDLGVLVEIHDEDELERALSADPTVIGINNRDLRTFDVDLSVTERLAPRIPESVVKVGESGIHTSEDVERLAAAGIDAVLVGESLMRQDDRAGAVRKLLNQ